MHTDVIEFVKQVFWSWAGLLAGVVMLFISLYERLAKQPLSKRVYGAIVALLLVVSPFFVWKREVHLRRLAEASLKECQARLVTARDSIEVLRDAAARSDSLQRASLARSDDDQNALAERQATVADLDREMHQRLAELKDSLEQTGALRLAPRRRPSSDYERAGRALRAFLAPRSALSNGADGLTTHEVVANIYRLDGDAEVWRALKVIEAITGPDHVSVSYVSNSWSEPDTVVVSYRERFSAGGRRPVADVLAMLEIRRWKGR